MPGGRTVTELEKRAVFVAIKLIEKVIFTFFFFLIFTFLSSVAWVPDLGQALEACIKDFPAKCGTEAYD